MGNAILLLLPAAFSGEEFRGHGYYAGDIHAHTGASADGEASDIGSCSSGGCAALSDIRQQALANHLDFLAITDHANTSVSQTPNQFQAVLEEVIADNDPSTGLVTIPAAEFAFRSPEGNLGHRNVYFFGRDSDLAHLSLQLIRPLGGPGSVLPSCDELHDWMTDLQSTWGDVLLIPHHPAASLPMATDWSCLDPAFEPVVEVYSSHGNNLEESPDYDPLQVPVEPTGTVSAALSTYGWMLGFVGGTDSHDTRPGETCSRSGPRNTDYGGGLTIAILPSSATLTRQTLHSALVQRQVYATSGPILPLDLAWYQGATELGGMGRQLALAESGDLHLLVYLPAYASGYVEGVELVSADGTRWSLSPSSGHWQLFLALDEAPDTAWVEVALDGRSWWGGACDDGGDDDTEYLWASPNRFR